MMEPTLGGFVAWVRSAMGISTSVLPDDSPYFGWAYNVAFAIVNQQLALIPPIYLLAVYNLGGSNLINWAQDVTPIVPYPPNTDSMLGFFGYMRKELGLNNYVSGTLTATADESTSSSFVVPKAAENFTLADLQLLKDPWGRTYLAYAQKAGPLWGLS